MNNATAQAIMAHFLTWSGGFPPDSPCEIFTYVTAACPFDVNETELFSLLTDWMGVDENDMLRFVDGRLIRDGSKYD